MISKLSHKYSVGTMKRTGTPQYKRVQRHMKIILQHET